MPTIIFFEMSIQQVVSSSFDIELSRLSRVVHSLTVIFFNLHRIAIRLFSHVYEPE